MLIYNDNQETKLQCFLVALNWMCQLAWLVLGARDVPIDHIIIIIRLLFEFASDLTNSINLQIVRR